MSHEEEKLLEKKMADSEGKLRIYADGVFDSFHIGHANMFKQCRELFD